MTRQYVMNSSAEVPEAQRDALWGAMISATRARATNYRLYTTESIRKEVAGLADEPFWKWLLDPPKRTDLQTLEILDDAGEVLAYHYDCGGVVSVWMTDEEAAHVAAVLKASGIDPEFADWQLACPLG